MHRDSERLAFGYTFSKRNLSQILDTELQNPTFLFTLLDLSFQVFNSQEETLKRRKARLEEEIAKWQAPQTVAVIVRPVSWGRSESSTSCGRMVQSKGTNLAAGQRTLSCYDCS